MQSKDMQTLMLNLEKWRVEHCISQAEMARRISLTPSTYSKLLSGDISTISADTIRDIYRTTGYMCYMLMDIYDDPFLRMGRNARKLTQEDLITVSEMLFTYMRTKGYKIE